MTGTTWGGGERGGLDPDAWSFLHSLPHDRFLWPHDVAGTIAHVEGLRAADVLSDDEAGRLASELRAIRGRPELIEETDEDVHSAIERVLTERLGDLGAKVHAGRSRNDQVATALRLWARAELGTVRRSVSEAIAAICDRAEEHAETLCPGYTHLQRAQPVTVGHWLCAHGFAFARDLERIDAARRAADVSPLGAGALATSTLGIDPSVAARELGFPRVFDNAMDAVSDRDFLADALYACSMAMTHLSRLAEEVILWASAEFGYVRLPAGWATGSSMMPQKRNPDVAELARGQAGRTVGALTGLLVTLKGLPLAYDRDLQTDKEHAHGVLGTAAVAFRAMAGLLGGLDFDTERLAAAVDDDRMLATDLAEALVGAGVPFRRAHEAVARLAAQGSIRTALDASPDALAPLGADQARSLLEARGGVERRETPGGPSPDRVREQVGTLRALLDRPG